MSKKSALQANLWDTFRDATALTSPVQNTSPSTFRLKALSTAQEPYNFRTDGAVWLVHPGHLVTPITVKGTGTKTVVIRVDTYTGETTFTSIDVDTADSIGNWAVVEVTDTALSIIVTEGGVLGDGTGKSGDTSPFKIRTIRVSGGSYTTNVTDVSGLLAISKSAGAANLLTKDVSIRAAMMSDGKGTGYVMLSIHGDTGTGGESGKEYVAREVHQRLRVNLSTGSVTSLGHRVVNEGLNTVHFVRFLAFDQRHIVYHVNAAIGRDGVFEVIDPATGNIKATQTLAASIAAGATSLTYNRHASAPRGHSWEFEVYGNELVAALSYTNGASTSNYKLISIVCSKDSGGSLTITRCELPTGHSNPVILSVGPDGCVYIKTLYSAYWQNYLLCYSPSGTLKWQVSFTYGGYGEEWFSRMMYTAEGHPAWRKAAQLNATLGHDIVSVVFAKATGSRMFNSNNSTIKLPNLPNGNFSKAFIDFDRYNPSTDTVDVCLAVVDAGITSHSATIPDIPAGRVYVAKTTLVNTLKMMFVDAEGQILPFDRNLKPTVKVGGRARALSMFPSANFWSAELSVGEQFVVTASAKKYKPVKITGTFKEGHPTIYIKLIPRDWTRKDYYVTNPTELQAIRDDDLGNYYIMNDIDMKGFAWEAMYIDPGAPFLGRIYGQGNTISNLTISDFSGVDCLGFIGAMSNSPCTDLSFDNCVVEGEANKALSMLCGMSTFEIVFDDNPLEELIRPFYHNIHCINCTIGNPSNSMDTGFIIGNYESNWKAEEALPAIFDDDPEKAFIDGCTALNSRIIGPEYGGYYIGGLVGQLEMN